MFNSEQIHYLYTWAWALSQDEMRAITAHAWGAHRCASLCSPNGQPAIQAKYTYSTLLAVSLLGCVVHASATLVTDFTRSL